MFRCTDKRNFDVQNPFNFGDFGVTEWDELREIIPKKKNQVVKCLMTSFSKRYERLRTIPEELGIKSNLPALEEPEYGMFFIDVFGDEAFSRMNGIHKVNIETLLTYLVMASNITTPKNVRFCLKLRKLIETHPDQEKLKYKKVKLESVGYKLDSVLINCFDYLL
nr:hypothetical protein [Tanacetum cinerariifolium]